MELFEELRREYAAGETAMTRARHPVRKRVDRGVEKYDTRTMR